MKPNHLDEISTTIINYSPLNKMTAYEDYINKEKRLRSKLFIRHVLKKHFIFKDYKNHNHII
jgi:hypothetical protein